MFSTKGCNSNDSIYGGKTGTAGYVCRGAFIEGKVYHDQLYIYISGGYIYRKESPYDEWYKRYYKYYQYKLTAGADFENPIEPIEPITNTFNFTKTLSWQGNVNGSGSNETDVAITEVGEGLYDINIKKLHFSNDDADITFSNVPGTVKGDGIVFSTNGETIKASITSKFGNSAVMTLEGKMLGDQLYLFCSGKYMNWSDNPFTITVGSDFIYPTIYTDNATTSSGGTNEQTFENATVDIYDNGDNTYKFVIKQLQLASYVIGDITVEGVTGVTNEDGITSYSFNGKAKISNVGNSASILNISEGSEIDFNLAGKSKDEKLYVNGSANISIFPISYVFGSDDFGSTDGISFIKADNLNGKTDIYTVNGVKVNALQKGINIVRMNGKTVKVVKK